MPNAEESARTRIRTFNRVAKRRGRHQRGNDRQTRTSQDFPCDERKEQGYVVVRVVHGVEHAPEKKRKGEHTQHPHRIELSLPYSEQRDQ
jgi:hypothetical protein